MDQTDFRILELLQLDARIPIAKLADTIGLSTPACYRRIQRLHKTRRIEREIAVVSPRTMGWTLSMIVLVTLERERTEIIDQFIRQLLDVPEIIEAWYVTGDYDFALRAVAEDMESFETMTRHVLYANEYVRSFKTLVSMRQIKTLSPIPAVCLEKTGLRSSRF